MTTQTRKEHDFLGEVDIPNDRLFGVNTHRGVANLTISPRTVGSNLEFSKAFAQCKWAAALANFDHGVLSEAQRRAIADACAEIVAGGHADSLTVDLLEGSGGTSTNMNFNEVIANRAQQLLGGELGVYDKVHPNDHVNRSQSTNDVYPAAMKMATHALLGPLIAEVGKLADCLSRKAAEFKDVLHLGRTCLQDAQPMTRCSAAMHRWWAGWPWPCSRCARACGCFHWAGQPSAPVSVRQPDTGHRSTVIW
jgi:aspartate ammonia-lyase